MDWKKRLVSSISATCLSSTLLLDTMDQVGEATLKINETLAHVSEGSVMEPQARDTIGMGIPGEDALGLLNPDHQGPVFPPVILEQPDLKPLLDALNVPEEAKLEITTVVRLMYDEKSHIV